LGNVAGKYTAKPRFAFTVSQLVMVVGVPIPTGVVAAVAVGGVVALAVGEVVAVAGVEDGVAVGETVGVTVGVTVDAAPSSRNNMDGWPHQCRLVNGGLAGMVVGVTVDVLPPPPPPNGLEQAPSSKQVSARPIDSPAILYGIPCLRCKTGTRGPPGKKNDIGTPLRRSNTFPLFLDYYILTVNGIL